MAKSRYEVCVRRLGPHGSQARSGRLSVQIDTTLSDTGNAFDAVQLLLASIGGSLIASIEAIAPILKFGMSGARAELRAELSDTAPVRIASIEYVLIVDTEESDPRLQRMFENAVGNAVTIAAIDPRIRLYGRVQRERPAG